MLQYLFPILTEQVSETTKSDLLADEDYLEKIVLEIEKENPLITSFINKFSEGSSDRSMTVTCGLLVYKLLKNQAELDTIS